MSNYRCFQVRRDRCYEASVNEQTGKPASRNLRALFPTLHDTMDYIPDQFLIVRRCDEKRFGEYRTRRVILEIYDAMAEAKRAGKPWVSWHANNGGIYARQ